MTQSSCKRDTKSKSHPGMKLAPVRVFSCKHPLTQACPFVSTTSRIRMKSYGVTIQVKLLQQFFHMVERFSSDLEMKTREQNRNNKRTEIERFDWFIERIQTHLGFGWLSERSGKQTSCPKNFLEIALTSYCNTIGQSHNAFSILGFSLAGKRRGHVLIFSSIG